MRFLPLSPWQIILENEGKSPSRQEKMPGSISEGIHCIFLIIVFYPLYFFNHFGITAAMIKYLISTVLFYDLYFQLFYLIFGKV